MGEALDVDVFVPRLGSTLGITDFSLAMDLLRIYYPAIEVTDSRVHFRNATQFEQWRAVFFRVLQAVLSSTEGLPVLIGFVHEKEHVTTQ